jgi:hypothetical protein
VAAGALFGVVGMGAGAGGPIGGEASAPPNLAGAWLTGRCRCLTSQHSGPWNGPVAVLAQIQTQRGSLG